MSLTKLTHKTVDRKVADVGADEIEKASKQGTETLMTELERYLPGFKEMGGSAAGLAKDWMAGKMSAAAQDQMAKRAQSRGINLGMPGSQFAGFGELADYGVNVMAMQQQGAALAQQLQGQAQQAVAPRLPQVGSMFLSAQDRLAHARGEADRSMEIDSWNAALEQQQAAMQAELDQMNRISAISARNRAQTSYSMPAVGMTNPFAGRTLADRRERTGHPMGGSYPSVSFSQNYAYPSVKRHSVYGYSAPYQVTQGYSPAATNYSAPQKRRTVGEGKIDARSGMPMGISNRYGVTDPWGTREIGWGFSSRNPYQ